MYVVMIRNNVENEYKDGYMKISRAFAQEMEQVTGCVKAEVMRSNLDDSIVNVEYWESKDVYEQYDGAVFMKYKKQLKEGFLGNTTETFII